MAVSKVVTGTVTRKDLGVTPGAGANNDSKIVAISKDTLSQGQTPAKTSSFFSRNATALKVSAGVVTAAAVVGGLVAKFGAEAVAAKTALVYMMAVHPTLCMLVTALGKTSLFALQHVVIPALLPFLTHAAVAAVVLYIVYRIVSEVVSALQEKGKSMYEMFSMKGMFNLLSGAAEAVLGFEIPAVEEKKNKSETDSPAQESAEEGFIDLAARFVQMLTGDNTIDSALLVVGQDAMVATDETDKAPQPALLQSKPEPTVFGEDSVWDILDLTGFFSERSVAPIALKNSSEIEMDTFAIARDTALPNASPTKGQTNLFVVAEAVAMFVSFL